MNPKKYNSVFTISLSIDHNELDASDVTMQDIIEAARRRLKDVEFDCPMETLTSGPEDTYEN